ncbi:SAM-dependent methyltransferase [Ectothiorhodospira shaposhnikovii]|uniref:SAM-dependent methyltransferase n=1 Tax=Ectothiorhodospira shaposhnikovii TaxID=1054 RepID=UPI00399F283D
MISHKPVPPSFKGGTAGACPVVSILWCFLINHAHNRWDSSMRIFNRPCRNRLFGASILLMMLCSPLSLQAQTQETGGGLFLVSTGTGDIGHMTQRAMEIIQGADVIFTMRQSREKFEHLLDGKEIHDAGHGLFQSLARRDLSDADADVMENTVRAIIRDAIAQGKRVVILDNGDPTLYGPHMGYVKEFHDLSPVIIPGMSSFNAANAAMGRSVVGSGRHASITITSARTEAENLRKLADAGSTLVIFMNRNLDEFTDRLKPHFAPDTAISIVTHAGDSGREQVTHGTLSNIVEKAADRIQGPHIIYIWSSL